MRCSQCGTELEQGQRRCPACSALLPKGGFWQRLWISLVGPVTTTRGVRKRKLENYTIVDKTTGQRRVYHSLAEVPPELRSMLEEAQASGKGVTKLVFTFQGPDGQKHTYNSLDEMPSDVRRTYEQIMREAQSGEDSEK